MKWDLGNMRIGTRMAVNMVVVLLFMGVALHQYYSVIQDIQARYGTLLQISGQIKSHASLINSLIQKADIGHGEFQLRRETKVADEISSLLKLAEEEISDLEGLERSVNDVASMTETRKLRESVAASRKTFQVYFKSVELRGLTDDLGMLGQMRVAAHALEDRINRTDSLLVQNHYLLMRRFEKDYLSRHDRKNVDKVKQFAELLRSDLADARFSSEEKSSLIGLLDNYLRTFINAMQEEENMVTNVQSFDSNMQQTVKVLEDKIISVTTSMENTEKETIQQTHNAQKNALVISIIAVVIAVVSAFFFVTSIRKMLAGVASSLSASASQIAAAINEQDRISSLQASSVNETNTTMEELGSSSRQSSEQSESAAGSAQKALEAAEHGMSRVEEMVSGMTVTKTKMDAIAQQILRLSEQTSQISSITSTVTDFANETKMLAMNAAVEAVRAGEHGKGFSVLAVEIRKLAEESKRSAERINGLVAEIQKATNSTVMATEEGGKTVDQGMMVAQNTAEAFAEVSEAVSNASQSSQQISLNVRQQAVAIKQVVEAMKSINTGSKETAAGISQVKTGTQVLNDAAQQLKSMI